MKARATERSAACATCGKTFARSDTLLRHEKSHHATEDRGPVHRVTNGTFRACSNCAQARSRCSGGNPCGRCKVRNIDCVYPNKRRKGESLENTTIKFEQDSSSGTHQPNLNQTTSIPSHNSVGQFQEFVFTQNTTAPYSGNGQLSRVQSNPEAQINSIMSSNSPQVHFDANQQHPMPSLQTQTPGSIGISVGGSSHPQQEQYSQSGVPAQFHPAYNGAGPDFAFDSNYDESLNWIPLSIYPSPYGDFEQDISFLLPSLSDTASIPNDFTPGQYDLAPPPMVTSEPQLQKSGSDLPISMIGFTQSPASSASDSIGVLRNNWGDNPAVDLKRKRRKSSFAADVFLRPRNTKRSFNFPDASELGHSVSSYAFCSQANYLSITTAFQQLCSGPSPPPFESNDFPDIAAVNACIELYFMNFHKSFPILHAATFGNETHWLAVLAAASIGSTFAKIPDAVDLREAFQEFLRRAIRYVEEAEMEDLPLLHLAQARILNLVGLIQSERDQLRLMAPKYHSELSRWCLEAGLLQMTTQDSQYTSASVQYTQEQELEMWHAWIRTETLRRIGYFVWLLDISVGYLCNARPLFNMDDARAPLPCQDVLWDASNPHDWLGHKSRSPLMPSLCDALEVLYNKKIIDGGISEISHILLLHALISRTYEVGTHIKQPLSEWKPTGNAKGFLNTPAKDNFWLPLYPLYANWRNSACDCLDVLHWHASSIAAKASGVEHDTLLYLHLARIVLLTPFQEIQDLLFYIIDHRVGPLSRASYYVHDGSYQSRTKTKAAQIKKITWRWLREDQHKARLAMIHAGSVLWHVRRYSSNNFNEPTAVYLATIVLWVYGSFKSTALGREAAATVEDAGPKKPNEGPAESVDNVQPSRVESAVRAYSTSRSRSDKNTPRDNFDTFSPTHSQAEANRHSDGNQNGNHESESADDLESESESDQPEFIYLDRPNDDEMVQHFVRSGHNMSAYISNIGDICKNPTKVLHEGAKLLKSKLASWGVSREYYDILMRLSEMRKNSSGAIVPVTPAPFNSMATPAAVQA